MSQNEEKVGIAPKVMAVVIYIIFLGFVLFLVNLTTGLGEALWEYAPASDKYTFDDFATWMIVFAFGYYVYYKLEKISSEVNGNKKKLERILRKMDL